MAPTGNTNALWTQAVWYGDGAATVSLLRDDFRHAPTQGASTRDMLLAARSYEGDGRREKHHGGGQEVASLVRADATFETSGIAGVDIDCMRAGAERNPGSPPNAFKERAVAVAR